MKVVRLVVVLTIMVFLSTVCLSMVFFSASAPLVGPGAALASDKGVVPYIDPDFDLTKHSIPIEEILSGGPPKDGIPSLTDPVFVRAEEAKFLKGSDRVIGVVIGEETGGGAARAYPIKILNWHEAVNDTIITEKSSTALLATW